jgi:hypothetical protein
MAKPTKKYKYNKQNPPHWCEVDITEWEDLVDEKSFPVCSVCNSRIYNPDFYDEEMCGPCTTGESRTLML